MYFAVEEQPRKSSGRCAMWAINLEWLEGKARELLRTRAASSEEGSAGGGTEYLNMLLGQTELPVIISIRPPYADERMVAQQGFFLCKLYHEPTFNQILMSVMTHPDTPDRPVVRKLEVDGDLRIGFLKHLREMNIHRASLFPDLDGFGHSLRLDLEIKARGEAARAELSISDLRKMYLSDPATEAPKT